MVKSPRQIYIGGNIPHIYRNQSGGVSCAFCSKEGASNFCSACKSVHYCNQKCQSSHWKEHRSFCKEKCKSAAKQGAQISHSSDSLSAKDDSEDKPICWVCFEDHMPMNNPCTFCKGTMGNVHEECILKIQLSKKKLQEKTQCSNCKRQFPPKFIAVILEEYLKKLEKKSTFNPEVILSLASCYIDGKFDDDKIQMGISMAMEVLDVYDKQGVADPNHPGITAVHSLIGRAHWVLKNYEMAIEVLGQSLDMQKAYLHTSPELTDDARTAIFVNMVETESSIALVLKEQKKYPEALKILNRLEKTAAKLAARRDDKPSQTRYHDILAYLADTHMQMGNYKEAVKAYGELLQILNKQTNTTGDLEIMDKMTICYVKLGLFEDALELLWMIVNTLKKNPILGTTDPKIVNRMFKIASVYVMQDEPGKALQIYSDVYQDQMINGCPPEVCDKTLSRIEEIETAMSSAQ